MAALDFVRAGGLKGEWETRRDVEARTDAQAALGAVKAELWAEAKRDERQIASAGGLTGDVLSDLLTILFSPFGRRVP